MCMCFCHLACRDEFVGYSLCSLPNTPGCHHVSCPVWVAAEAGRSLPKELTSKQAAAQHTSCTRHVQSGLDPAHGMCSVCLHLALHARRWTPLWHSYGLPPPAMAAADGLRAAAVTPIYLMLQVATHPHNCRCPAMPGLPACRVLHWPAPPACG
jgi:hypothetical protein